MIASAIQKSRRSILPVAEFAHKSLLALHASHMYRGVPLLHDINLSAGNISAVTCISDPNLPWLRSLSPSKGYIDRAY